MVSGLCQMASKVSQICCREDLNRVHAQVISWIPLLDLELDETTKVKNTDNKLVGKLTSSGRSFTSFQMVHTHASLPRGWFLATAKLLAKLLSGP